MRDVGSAQVGALRRHQRGQSAGLVHGAGHDDVAASAVHLQLRGVAAGSSARVSGTCGLQQLAGRAASTRRGAACRGRRGGACGCGCWHPGRCRRTPAPHCTPGGRPAHDSPPPACARLLRPWCHRAKCARRRPLNWSYSPRKHGTPNACMPVQIHASLSDQKIPWQGFPAPAKLGYPSPASSLRLMFIRGYTQ